MFKNRFCFKILSDAGVAHDGEGNNVPAFLETTFDTQKPLTDDEHAGIHENLIPALSSQLGIKKEYLVKISSGEYDNNQ